MMYTLVIVLLPEVMNELYTTNDQIHDHFTRQDNFFNNNKGRSMFTQDALVILVREFGMLYRQKN